MGVSPDNGYAPCPATLRQSLSLKCSLRSYVDGVLDLVELRSLANAMVGEPGGGGVGLSLEQRKRLSIAVELVASPAILFLE